ncbi:MAG: DUF4249 family protein [Bacteroidetes bacterium]|nr:DUF4249 family protein [Bacteroidota bacterium]
MKMKLSKIINNAQSQIGLGLMGITLTLMACEKTVYFDVDTKEDRLVVTGFFEPDSNIYLYIDLSEDPLAIGLESFGVENATISISKNDENLGAFSNEFNGVYSFSGAALDAQGGDEIKINVSAPGKESVTSTTIIPSAIPLFDVAITDTVLVPLSYSYIDEFGNVIYIDTIVPYFNIQLSFNDPQGEDYYALKITYRDAFSESFTCFNTSDPTFTVNNDYAFGNENENGTTTLCDEVLFTDVTFENTKKTMHVELYALNTDFITDPRFEIELTYQPDCRRIPATIHLVNRL